MNISNKREIDRPITVLIIGLYLHKGINVVVHNFI